MTDEPTATSPGDSRTKRRVEVPQRVADELRRTIVAGEMADGEPLGNEAGLIEQFGVSRPSLREALRILEAEGLITVQRGVTGGVVARRPDPLVAARSAALVLQSRSVRLADVLEARNIIEPAAVRLVAKGAGRERACARLREFIELEVDAVEDPAAFGVANARFHEELVRLGGNATLTIVMEMLNDVVSRAVTAVSRAGASGESVAVRRRGIRSQRRLLELIEAGDGEGAAIYWREHMDVVSRVVLGQKAKTVVDLLDEY